MKVKSHQISNKKIAEVTSEKIIINSVKDGQEFLGNLYYQNFDNIIINKKHITEDFFELRNGIAGEILQKLSNLRVQLIIVGDFSECKKIFHDFIYESNKGKLINFVSTSSEALKMLSK